ncbi:MAG: hypothetical protein KJ630_21445 [Proteobacteria bacterium]|nr:hypothetical protein [Pseudomonadota bacterium]
MKSNLWSVFVLLAGVFSISTNTAISAEVYPTIWWKVAFNSPVPFSPPKEIGMDAVALLYPAKSKLGQSQLEVTLVALPKEMQESFANNDVEIANYVKGTFLASAKSSEKTTKRTFLGIQAVGEIQSTSIPKSSTLELYLLPLSDGDKIAVAFSKDSAMASDAAEGIIKMIASTFKEVPAR